MNLPLYPAPSPTPYNMYAPPERIRALKQILYGFEKSVKQDTSSKWLERKYKIIELLACMKTMPNGCENSQYLSDKGIFQMLRDWIGNAIDDMRHHKAELSYTQFVELVQSILDLFYVCNQHMKTELTIPSTYIMHNSMYMTAVDDIVVKTMNNSTLITDKSYELLELVFPNSSSSVRAMLNQPKLNITYQAAAVPVVQPHVVPPLTGETIVAALSTWKQVYYQYPVFTTFCDESIQHLQHLIGQQKSGVSVNFNREWDELSQYLTNPMYNTHFGFKFSIAPDSFNINRYIPPPSQQQPTTTHMDDLVNIYANAMGMATTSSSTSAVTPTTRRSRSPRRSRRHRDTSHRRNRSATTGGPITYLEPPEWLKYHQNELRPDAIREGSNIDHGYINASLSRYRMLYWIQIPAVPIQDTQDKYYIKASVSNEIHKMIGIRPQYVAEFIDDRGGNLFRLNVRVGDAYQVHKLLTRRDIQVTPKLKGEMLPLLSKECTKAHTGMFKHYHCSYAHVRPQRENN